MILEKHPKQRIEAPQSLKEFRHLFPNDLWRKASQSECGPRLKDLGLLPAERKGVQLEAEAL